MEIAGKRILGVKEEVKTFGGIYIPDSAIDSETLVPVKVKYVGTEVVNFAKDNTVYVNVFSIKDIKLKGEKFVLINEGDIIAYDTN